MTKITAQDLASYAALVVAMVALYVGWDQSRITRNQQHADVFPVIQLKTQYLLKTNEEGVTARHLTFEAFNAGVGPAFAESGRLEINNVKISHVGELSKLYPTGLQELGSYQGQFTNFILAPGKSEMIWEVAFPSDEKMEPLLNQFMHQFWAMEMQVCYCSLYEKCWVSEYNPSTPKPRPVEHCN
ncbi:MAG: hypothetical protein GJ680_09955 [Alteromonadaceae bacterium]|nr:hypothetical protein [Alteromonadaceae bacterium]